MVMNLNGSQFENFKLSMSRNPVRSKMETQSMATTVSEMHAVYPPNLSIYLPTYLPTYLSFIFISKLI